MHTYKWIYTETENKYHPAWYFVCETTVGSEETTILIEKGKLKRVWGRGKAVGFPRNPPMGKDYGTH